MRIIVGHNEAYYYAYRMRARMGDLRRVGPVDVTRSTVLWRAADVVRVADLLTAANIIVPTAGAPGTLLRPDAGAAQGAGVHHIVVPADCNRRVTVRAVRHRWAAPIPAGALVHAGPGICVATPELAWLQLAGALTPTQLVLAGCALCARYLIDGDTGLLVSTDPATTPSALAAMVSACPGAYGVARARRALPYIAAGAESPAELAAFSLICLPPALGGMGAPVATLNHELRIDTAERLAIADRPDRRSFRVDLAWPSRGCGVEYLGKLHDAQADADRDRLNALTALGLRILQVKHADLAHSDRLVRLTLQVAAVLGVDPPADTPQFRVARSGLLQELLGPFALRL